MSYEDLSDQLKITSGTADNLVRDMVVVGHAEANRKTGRVTALQADANEAADIVVGFCRSHVLYRSVLERFGVEGAFSLDDVIRVAVDIYARLHLSDAVLGQYARRVMQWCVAAGLVDRVAGSYYASNSSHGVSGLTTSGARNTRGRGFFLGDAPPERVLAAFADVMGKRLQRTELINRHGMQTFQSLCALGLTDNRGALLVSGEEEPEDLLRRAARDNPALHLVREVILEDSNVTGITLGTQLGIELGATWSEQTRARNGNAVRRWVGWTWPEEFRWGGRGNSRRLHPIQTKIP